MAVFDTCHVRHVVGDGLGFVEPVLVSLHQIIDRYIGRHAALSRPDVPYRYGERSTVSLLAGAVWLSGPGNLVLEEPAATKQSSVGPDKYGGRADIWFMAADQRCYAGAKREEVYLTQLPTEAAASEAVDAARHAVQWLHNQPTEQWDSLDFALGLQFVIPYLTARQAQNADRQLDQYYQKFEAHLHRQCESRQCEMLWGHYVCPALVGPGGLYSTDEGELTACPCLDTVICLATDGRRRLLG